MTIVGSHVSTRKGYREAARSAKAMGGDAFQYFPSNPRTLQLKQFDRGDAERCAAWCREEGVVSIGHSAYLINPAAEGDAALQMAASVWNDLAIAEACGSLGTVVHFGVFKGDDPLKGYRRIIEWIDLVLARWDGKAMILLENQAGDHGPAGTTPEELTQIRSLCERPEAVGFCLDTCHLFASGEWDGTNGDSFRERCDRLGFWDALVAVHLNDSRYPAGAKRDRHAAIGQGCIGDAGFRDLLALPRLREVPLILETPAGPDGTHRAQIARVRRLREGDATL
ncbi:deoxyribonuclease IV [Cohnella nanjingensis]|uniref:Deoxyribonuclease IV n=1 Tax=Cohnella nanjingensis TaxID=1387779 RepID=A0A7X0VDG1_9BACL|nr:deoxyribonuclease IV [Cohnella nanjingensis]MBB6669173.1 deoxyribonuclease IV [Cohnella nanjingensis]